MAAFDSETVRITKKCCTHLFDFMPNAVDKKNFTFFWRFFSLYSSDAFGIDAVS